MLVVLFILFGVANAFTVAERFEIYQIYQP